MSTPNGTTGTSDISIDVQHLSKRFGYRVAVEDLSLSVRPGEICGLTGANGGGKSTTLRLLAGLLVPDRGAGNVLGRDLSRGARQVRQHVGYLAQRSTLYPTLSVRENLRFRGAVFGLRNPTEAAERQIVAFDLSEFSATSVGKLSGGWHRQVDLAAAVMHRPRVLLLDEPTAGLDPAARQAIWRRLMRLSAEGAAIVLATHDFGEAHRCTRVVLLSHGQVRATGAPGELAKQFPASALIVSGRGAMSLADRLKCPEVIAAHPSGESLRLIVATGARNRVEGLIAFHGYQSRQVSLTLEDIALAITQDARGPH